MQAAEAHGHIILGMTWSFKVKNTMDDGVAGLKFKARLNVRGDQQQDKDINPDHRASPTADIESIRMLIATLAGTPDAEWLKFDMVAGPAPSTHIRADPARHARCGPWSFTAPPYPHLWPG